MPDIKSFLDTTGVTYLIQKLRELFVAKEEGMGLSEENFTAEDAVKLDSLTNYTLPAASRTVLGGIKVGANLSMAEDGTLSASPGMTSVTWDDVTGKPELALKSDIVGVYIYKGSVASRDDLPLENREVGDVWNTEADNMNYAWTGVHWDPLGSVFSISSISNETIDSILGAS